MSAKLNLAAGGTRFAHGWINVDIASPPTSNSTISVRANLLRTFPFKDECADVVYISHFLEHLEPFDECAAFLLECKRIMRKGSVIRISVPDLQVIAAQFCRDPRSFYAEYGFSKPWFHKAQSWSRRLGVSIMHGHKMIFDYTALEEILLDAGFSEPIDVLRSGSRLPMEIIDEVIPTHLSHSLVVDARKAKD